MSDNIKGQQDFTTDSSEFNATAFQIAQAVRRINTAEPVRVVSVQPGAVGPVGMVSVQPLVNLVTGMGDGMTQSELFSLPYLRVQGGENASFLGMQDIRLIPLATAYDGEIGNASECYLSYMISLDDIDDTGGEDWTTGTTTNGHDAGRKIYTDVNIPTGTNTFLFYGQAKYDSYSTDADKWFAQGALETSLDDGDITTAADIGFNLKQILTNRGDLTTPQNALRDQLNDVMGVSGWSTLTDDTPSNPNKATLIALHDAMQTLKAGSANAIKAAGEPISIPSDMDRLLAAFAEKGIRPE